MTRAHAAAATSHRCTHALARPLSRARSTRRSAAPGAGSGTPGSSSGCRPSWSTRAAHARAGRSPTRHSVRARSTRPRRPWLASSSPWSPPRAPGGRRRGSTTCGRRRRRRRGRRKGLSRRRRGHKRYERTMRDPRTPTQQSGDGWGGEGVHHPDHPPGRGGTFSSDGVGRVMSHARAPRYLFLGWGRPSYVTRPRYLFLGWGRPSYVTRPRYLFLGWGRPTYVTRPRYLFLGWSRPTCVT